MDNIYTAKELPGLKNPHPLVAALSMVGGVIILVIVAVWLLIFWALLGNMIDWIVDLANGHPLVVPQTTPDAAADILRELMVRFSAVIYTVTSLFFVPKLFKLGWQKINHGFIEKMAGGSVGTIPGNFESADDLVAKIRNQEVIINGDMGIFSKTVFGPKVEFLSPVAGIAAKPLLNSLKAGLSPYLRLIFVAILIGGGCWFLWSSLVEAAAQEPIARAIVENTHFWKWYIALLVPIVLYGVVKFLIYMVQYIAIRGLIPTGAPVATSDSIFDNFSVDMHPSLIVEQIPSKFRSLEWQNFPNRIMGNQGEKNSVSISNSGEFEASLLIEQQPQPLGNPYEKEGKLLLMTGWAMALISLIVFLFVVYPRPLMNALLKTSSVDANYLISPVYVTVATIITFMLWAYSKSMLTAGEYLLNVNRFRSPIAFIRLKGDLGKGEAQLGNLQDESFRTTTEFVKCNFLAEIMTTELYSETETPSGIRKLVAMANTRESEIWKKYALLMFKQFHAWEVEPSAINVDSEKAKRMTRANAELDYNKQMLRHDARLKVEQSYQMGQNALTGIKVEQLPGVNKTVGRIETDNGEDSKE